MPRAPLGWAAALLALCGATSAWSQDATTGFSGSRLDDAGLGGSLAGTLPDETPGGTVPFGSLGGPDAPDAGDGNRAPLRPTLAPAEPSTAKLRAGPPRLPPLQPYPVPSRPRGAIIDTADPTTLAPVVGPTVAALPVAQLPRRARPDLTPFAPLGFTLGGFRLLPYAEQSFGFDSNPDQVAVGVRPSGFSRTEGGFDLLSFWSANELRATAHGAYTDFFADPGANRPDAAGVFNYRHDVSRDLALDAEGRFALSTQRPGSPELNVNVRDRPLVSSVGASLGGSDTLGRLTLALHGTIDRTDYENALLGDGTVVRLDDETFNAYGAIGRASYELTPGLIPFVELRGDTRVHDRPVDASGFARDSDGISAKLGSRFEMTRLITGEISAGYGDRSYRDRRLTDLKGALVDASLVYAVTPLTTVTLLASTSFDETTVPGSPGAEDRGLTLQVSHALLRNLTLTGLVSYLNTDYQGVRITENTISETLKASYSLGRSFVIEASYNHEDLLSSLPLSSFSQDVFLAGLRVQH